MDPKAPSLSTDGTSADHYTVAHLKRTHPALVDPSKHDNDTHKLGLILRSMLTLKTTTSEQGLTVITWKCSCDSLITDIHSLIHAAASAAQFAEGEAAFFAHVCEVISLATQFEDNATHHHAHRQRQMLWWMEVWTDISCNLRDATCH